MKTWAVLSTTQAGPQWTQRCGPLTKSPMNSVVETEPCPEREVGMERMLWSVYWCLVDHPMLSLGTQRSTVPWGQGRMNRRTRPGCPEEDPPCSLGSPRKDAVARFLFGKRAMDAQSHTLDEDPAGGRRLRWLKSFYRLVLLLMVSSGPGFYRKA